MAISNFSKGVAQADFNVHISSTFSSYDATVNYLAGDYLLTSRLSDLTLDIYLIASDGSLAGYSSNSLTITASKPFNKVVTLGGTIDDIINFAYKATYTSTGETSEVKAGPVISSLSTYSLPSINSSTTVTGLNFAGDVTVTFTGKNNTTYNAKSVTRNSATEIVVVRPDLFSPINAPYTMTVQNPGVNSPSKNNFNITTVTTAANPTWVTSAGALDNMVRTVSYGVSVSATDSSSTGTLQYSIVSGSLPTGLTLNKDNGSISGTPITSNGSPYGFTIRAQVHESARTDRTFSISQVKPDAPTSVTATVITSGSGVAYGSTAIDVSFAVPADGPAPVNYTAYSSQSTSVTGSSSPLRFTGLQGSTNFYVRANNVGGQSLDSNTSNTVTTSSVPAKVGTPSNSSPDNEMNRISWSAPNNGGSSITAYLLKDSYDNGVINVGNVTTYDSSEPGGTNHQYSVAAVNANGTGTYSDLSSSVTTQSFSFSPFGFYDFFGFFDFGDWSLGWSTELLTVENGLAKVGELKVGDKLLALDIEGADKLTGDDSNWKDWFSTEDKIKSYPIVETTIKEILINPATHFININGQILTEFHRVLVKKEDTVLFEKARNLDSTYLTFSYEKKEFVPIELIEDVILPDEVSSYSIICEPHKNFFMGSTLVFDRWTYSNPDGDK
jgi:hypothetical protein